MNISYINKSLDVYEQLSKISSPRFELFGGQPIYFISTTSDKCQDIIRILDDNLGIIRVIDNSADFDTIGAGGIGWYSYIFVIDNYNQDIIEFINERIANNIGNQHMPINVWLKLCAALNIYPTLSICGDGIYSIYINTSKRDELRMALIAMSDLFNNFDVELQLPNLDSAEDSGVINKVTIYDAEHSGTICFSCYNLDKDSIKSLMTELHIEYKEK